MPPLMRNPSSQGYGAPSPSPFTMPGSPARSLSTTSVAGSMAAPEQSADTPEMSSVPSLTAASGINMHGGMPMYTPPQTPGYVAATPVAAAPVAPGAATAVKRENEGGEDGSRDKRRRIAPTLVPEQ
jgi:chromatin assembly factor 1 subunit B